MALEDELRPAFVRAADRMLGTLSDPAALEEIRRSPSTCLAYSPLDIKEAVGPHYLQVQVSQVVDLMDGYRSEAGAHGSIPTQGQASVLAEFLSEGPRRAVREIRSVLDALVEAGASKDSLVEEVDLAFVRAVLES